MSRSRLLAALAASLVAMVLLLGATPLGTAAWRAAYPHLPRGAQALPYRVRALTRPPSTPVQLPTTAASISAAANTPPPVGLAAATAGHTAPLSGSDRSSEGPSEVEPLPSATDTPPPQSHGDVQPLDPDLPPAAVINESSHQYQTWNNCGPATIGMALGALGEYVSQAEAARLLKPDPDDKNVDPHELAGFAHGRGYEAAVISGGTLDQIKAFLALGAPVIAEIWFIPDPGDEMGHYVMLRGYDDAAGEFSAYDSYMGPNRRLNYADFDAHWRVFNRTMIVVYGHEQVAAVGPLVSAWSDHATMYGRATTQALAEVEAQPDAFGWFNLGSSLVGMGDMAAAADAFDRARAVGLPWRMLWYQFGPFEAYGALGRWDDVEALAEANLRNAPNLEESLYWRGMARKASGDLGGARADFERALHFNPRYAPAQSALDAP